MKIRGTASHIYEKYQTLARDASASGDRVASENYLQHAEHYFRILNANNASQNHSQGQSPNQEQGQPHTQSQPPYHSEGGSNGRGRGNGQQMAGASEEGPEDVGGVIRTLSRSDEARTIEPAASGPTSFEPVPEDVPPDASEKADAEPAAPHAEAGADGDESQEAKRKKSSAKQDTDTASAG